MKIFFTDQQKQFPKYLLEFKNRSIIPYQKNFLNHKISRKVLDCKFSNLYFNSFFDYQIFPSNILAAYPQWIEEKRAVQAGDTIVQQINIPPFNMLSQRFIVAVRIKEVFDSGSCKGFSYETLSGHLEKGISTFKIEPERNISVFTIETYSAPAVSLLKLFQPFSSLYQDYCTSQALANVKQKLSC